MERIWRQFQSLLTPGVRMLTGVLATIYLSAVIGRVTGAFDLPAWFSLSGRQFWSGQIWRVGTYSLVPAGLRDFIMNGLALILLGGLVERVRGRGELWVVCAVSAAGAGLVKVILQASSPISLVGAGPVVFGLLAAWCFLCGHQKIMILPFGEMAGRQLALLAGAVSFFFTAFSAGWRIAVIMFAGGLSGWFYFWLRHKRLMDGDSQVVHSERINRLEL